MRGYKIKKGRMFEAGRDRFLDMLKFESFAAVAMHHNMSNSYARRLCFNFLRDYLTDFYFEMVGVAFGTDEEKQRALAGYYRKKERKRFLMQNKSRFCEALFAEKESRYVAVSEGTAGVVNAIDVGSSLRRVGGKRLLVNFLKCGWDDLLRGDEKERYIQLIYAPQKATKKEREDLYFRVDIDLCIGDGPEAVCGSLLKAIREIEKAFKLKRICLN